MLDKWINRGTVTWIVQMNASQMDQKKGAVTRIVQLNARQMDQKRRSDLNRTNEC